MREIILVVEDDEGLLAGLQMGLEMEGFQVLTARDGLEALELMRKTKPDLLIVDIMMPRLDGYSFLKRVREKEAWLAIPVIFLTAKSDKADVRLGKELGVEDYLTKPFEMMDLLSTVRGKLRRSEELMKLLHPRLLAGGNVLEVGDLRLDFARHSATFQGQSLHLTPTEYRLLACLARRAGQVLSCREIVGETHHLECGEQEARELIIPHIKNLRAKLEPERGNPCYIVNVRGVGYMFTVPEEGAEG
ncbi:MAG TPA: response regulator transcription factor [Anaerolineae bacterium]|nr:response regulator transcription factor [Anaerolineae bacterium]